MAKVKLTKKVVDELVSTGTDVFLWDCELTGFGLKLSAKGRRVYIVQYRAGGGRRGNIRRFTIGAHGAPWTAETARAEARKLLGAVATGEDPAAAKQEGRQGMTVAELCDTYMQHGCATKKASTLASDRGRITRHIKPLLGHRKVADLTKADIRHFLNDVASGKTSVNVRTRRRGRARVTGGQGTASRTVGFLGGILSYAVELGVITHNPVHGVKRFPDRKCERFLSEVELARLGEALSAIEQTDANICGIAVIKLLIFTGARKGEIEGLKWREIDMQRGLLRLEDSKTGQKIILLNDPAINVLRDVPKDPASIYVFPAAAGSGHYVGVPKIWRQVKALADLPDLRLHDLRHSFASIAVAGGASLPIIGALLGHSDAATTKRYAHLSNDPLRRVNDITGQALAAALKASVSPDASARSA
ncbi:MAG: tyrosine-type recombinase/integrase [Bosea sp. (in: a-proteobacteria)]